MENIFGKLTKEEESLLQASFRMLKSAKVPETPVIPISKILTVHPAKWGILSLAETAIERVKQMVPALGWAPAVGSVAVLILALMIVPRLVWQHGQETIGMPTSCVLQSVSGQALITHGMSERTAQAGHFLEEGMHIKTLARAKVQLRAGKDVGLLLDEESELIMERLRIDPTSQSRDLTFLLKEGQVFCEVGKTGARTTLNILTPEASFQVVGTRFEVIRSPEMGSHLSVFEGIVRVTSKISRSKPTEVKAGFQAQVLIKQGSEGVTVKPLKYLPTRDLSYESPVGMPSAPPDINEDVILNNEREEDVSRGTHIEQVYEDKDYLSKGR